MAELILIAASGLAREALSVLAATRAHEIVGFLDDEPGLAGTLVAGRPVLGSLADLSRFPDASFVVCAGRGAVRRRLVDRLTAYGVSAARYVTILDPSVRVPTGCSIGAGSVVLANVVLTADVQLGRHVVVMPNVTLTHDDTIADYATLCAGVTLGGNVTVGTAAYVGMNASVRERVTVGPEATLGMGGVLLEDLPAHQIWAGVPARAISADHGARSTHQSREELSA